MSNVKIKSRVPSDVVAGILGFLGADRFTGDPKRIHTTLAGVRRHYSILNVFNFTVGDVYPFSRELEDSLSILQRSRIIRMENADYDTYMVEREAKKFIQDNIHSSFDSEEIVQLKELAEIFWLECGETKIINSPPDGLIDQC